MPPIGLGANAITKAYLGSNLLPQLYLGADPLLDTVVGTLVFKDTFTDVDGTSIINHVPDIGVYWDSGGTFFLIQGNRLTANSANQRAVAFAAAPVTAGHLSVFVEVKWIDEFNYGVILPEWWSRETNANFGWRLSPEITATGITLLLQVDRATIRTSPELPYGGGKYVAVRFDAAGILGGPNMCEVDWGGVNVPSLSVVVGNQIVENSSFALWTPTLNTISGDPATADDFNVYEYVVLNNDIVFDAFTDPDGTLLTAHTPDIGGPWTVDVLESLVITNNAISEQAPVTSTRYESVITVPVDFTLTLDLESLGDPTAGNFYTVFYARYIAQSDRLTITIHIHATDPGQSVLQVSNSRGGVTETIVKEVIYVAPSQLSITIAGYAMTASISGTEIYLSNLDVANVSTALKMGMFKNAAVTPWPIWDNFRVILADPPAIDYLFNDNFTDPDGTLLTDHTPDVGNTWTGGSANIVISGNKVSSLGITATTTAFSSGILSGDKSYHIKVDLGVVGSGLRYVGFYLYSNNTNALLRFSKDATATANVTFEVIYAGGTVSAPVQLISTTIFTIDATIVGGILNAKATGSNGPIFEILNVDLGADSVAASSTGLYFSATDPLINTTVDFFRIELLSPPPLVFDSFTDTPGTLLTAHTPDIGGPWTAGADPSLVITNNALGDQSFVDGERWRNLIATTTADVEITLDLEALGSAGGDYFMRIDTRYVDDNDFVSVTVRMHPSSPSDRYIEVSSMVLGVATTVKTVVILAAPAMLVFTVVGATATAEFLGEVATVAVDAANTSTTARLSSWGYVLTGTTQPVWDNLRIDAI